MTLMRDGSVHQVVNPRLQDEEINSVSEQLTAILHGDFLAEYGDHLASPPPAASEPCADEPAEDEPAPTDEPAPEQEAGVETE